MILLGPACLRAFPCCFLAFLESAVPKVSGISMLRIFNFFSIIHTNDMLLHFFFRVCFLLSALGIILSDAHSILAKKQRFQDILNTLLKF